MYISDECAHTQAVRHCGRVYNIIIIIIIYEIELIATSASGIARGVNRFGKRLGHIIIYTQSPYIYIYMCVVWPYFLTYLIHTTPIHTIGAGVRKNNSSLHRRCIYVSTCDTIRIEFECIEFHSHRQKVRAQSSR